MVGQVGAQLGTYLRCGEAVFGGDYSNSSACVPMEELNLARWNVRRKGRTCEAVLEPGPSPPASRSPVSAGLELRPPAAPSDSGRVPRAAEHRHAATVPRSRARSAPLPGDAALFRDGAAGLRPAERLGRARRGARGDRAARVRSCGRARGGSAAGAARPRSGCGPPAIRRGRGGASWAGPPPVQARSGAGTSRPALLGGCRRWSGPSAEGGGPGPGSDSLGYGRCGRGSPAVRPPRSGPARPGPWCSASASGGSSPRWVPAVLASRPPRGAGGTAAFCSPRRHKGRVGPQAAPGAVLWGSREAAASLPMSSGAAEKGCDRYHLCRCAVCGAAAAVPRARWVLPTRRTPAGAGPALCREQRRCSERLEELLLRAAVRFCH